MANVPFGHAACATRAVSSGMGPNSRGYMDMVLLLTQTFFDDFFLALYHSSIACIRQQSPKKEGGVVLVCSRVGIMRLGSVVVIFTNIWQKFSNVERKVTLIVTHL